MSTLDDIITAIQTVIDKLDEASQVNSAGSSETDDALNTAAALGANSMVDGLSSLKDDFESFGSQLAGVHDQAEAMLTKAQALRDGT